MEFVFIGLSIIASSVIYKLTRDLGFHEADDIKNKSDTESIGVFALGAIMLFIGIYGLLSGIYPTTLSERGVVTLFFVVSAVNIQARLLNYASVNESEAVRINNAKSNGIEALRIALSVGLFPKAGRCIFFIHMCQIVQLISICLFILM